MSDGSIPAGNSGAGGFKPLQSLGKSGLSASGRTAKSDNDGCREIFLYFFTARISGRARAFGSREWSVIWETNLFLNCVKYRRYVTFLSELPLKLLKNKEKQRVTVGQIGQFQPSLLRGVTSPFVLAGFRA